LVVAGAAFVNWARFLGTVEALVPNFALASACCGDALVCLEHVLVVTSPVARAMCEIPLVKDDLPLLRPAHTLSMLAAHFPDSAGAVFALTGDSKEALEAHTVVRMICIRVADALVVANFASPLWALRGVLPG